MGSNIIDITKCCRLCACETETGFTIFDDSEDKASLDILINKYLPIKVYNDGKLPTQICTQCQNGVAATVDLIDRMVEGQHQLRIFLENVVIVNDSYSATSLIDLQGDTPDITMDDLGKGSHVQKVYDESHEVALAVSGCKPNVDVKKTDTKLGNDVDFEVFEPPSLLDMTNNTNDLPLSELVKDLLDLPCEENTPVKRKRGRPNKSESQKSKTPIKDQLIPRRPKRKINVPTRYRDTVEGNEYEDTHKSDNDVSTLIDFKLEEEFFNDEIMDNMNDMNMNSNDDISASPHIYPDGTSIILSADNSQPQQTIPASVNIEVNFKDDGNISLSGVDDLENYSSLSVKTVKHQSIQQRKFGLNGKKKRVQRKKPRWVCEICGKGLLHKGRYLLHMKLHKAVLLQCNDCKDRFLSKDELSKHQASTGHQGLGIIENARPENEEDFVSNSEKIPNNELNTGVTPDIDKLYPCDICNKKFTQEIALRRHMAMHELTEVPGDRKFNCDVCNKAFTHTSSLLYHREAEHTNGRVFICNVCGSSFKHKLLLQRHFAVHSNDRPFPCELCDMAFKTRGNLYNHINIHTQQKKYTCEVCGKQFSHLTSLNLHIRSHTGEKPFKCTYCDKKFSQNGNLKEHLRIHTGEKPFVCHICGKQFTTSSQRKNHARSHANGNAFTCSRCPKKFTNKEAWQTHERRHNGELSVNCRVCEKSFVDQNSLKKHLKTHEEKSLTCELCNKEFVNVESLKKHSDLEHFMTMAVSDIDSNTQEEDQSQKKCNLESYQQIFYILPKVEYENSNSADKTQVGLLGGMSSNASQMIEIPKNLQSFNLDTYSEGTAMINSTQQVGSQQMQILSNDEDSGIMPVLARNDMASTFLPENSVSNVSSTENSALLSSALESGGTNSIQITIKEEQQQSFNFVLPPSGGNNIYGAHISDS